MSTEAKPVVQKKKIIKIKKTQQAPVENNEQKEMVVEEQKDNNIIIPSSRIKNYISREKLNKEFDQLIEKIKKKDPELDLKTVLNVQQQSQLGNLIKKKEENKETFDITDLVVDIISKQKYKFSNTSFKVLSVFLDSMVEEITQHAMEELIKHKKAIVNTKYVYSNEDPNLPLYKIYSSLPTYMNELNNLNKASEPVDESAEESVPVESNQPETEPEENTKNINFEFYIRKVCNKLKKSKEEFASLKVSERYQKFCSNLILEFLDKTVPMIVLLLEVMTTKTITNLVFETIIKFQLIDNPEKDSIMKNLKEKVEKCVNN